MDPNTPLQKWAEADWSTYFVNHGRFTANFELLCERILFYGRTRRPTVIMIIAEFLGNARTDRLVGTAFLCYITEEEAYRDGQDRALIAFQYLIYIVPAGEPIVAHMESLPSGSQLYPKLVIQGVDGTYKYYIHHRDALVDISQSSSDAGYAVYTLFLYYIHNSIPFPPEIAVFYDFMNFFLVELPPRQGFMRPSDTSSSVCFVH